MRSSLGRAGLAASVALLLSGAGDGMLRAGPRLELADGRILTGTDLQRDGELIILHLADGSVIPIPAPAVAHIEWVEEGKTAGATRSLNIVKGRSDAEAAEAEARGAARDAENEVWVANQMAEMEQRDRQEEIDRAMERARRDAGFNQPSGFIWQQNYAGSTLQPSYWVPDSDQSIGNWP